MLVVLYLNISPERRTFPPAAVYAYREGAGAGADLWSGALAELLAELLADTPLNL